ncbi:hypothetical protein Peur_063647 [Populus x canadensis]
MEVKILSQKFIKPSIQTLDHLTNVKLSFIDQLAPPVYAPMILHYSALYSEAMISERRYTEDRNLVVCNDEEVLFFEAKVSGQLAQLLQGERLIPIVLADQINRFNCGGLVIGLCVSHWVADGHAIGSFLEAWATVCRARMHEMICSSFQAGALYPATDVLRLGTPVPGYCYKSDCHKKKNSFL